jgi:hypothetical protein
VARDPASGRATGLADVSSPVAAAAAPAPLTLPEVGGAAAARA